MPNSLYNEFAGGQMTGQMGDLRQMMSAFQRFKQSFRGDARQEVQNLLNSGQMSQQEYTQLQQMTDQMARMMG